MNNTLQEAAGYFEKEGNENEKAENKGGSGSSADSPAGNLLLCGAACHQYPCGGVLDFSDHTDRPGGCVFCEKEETEPL